MTTAFVLSGGGVLGAGHVGSLEVLEERGIRPDLIVGTSAGAIVGGIYASGGLDAVNACLDNIADMFVGPRAVLMSTPSKLFSYLEALLAEVLPRKYADLPIPFHPVATNLRTGRYKAFSEGDPVAGILASAAYPGVFPPKEIDGEWYADGGLTANLPATAARELGATFLIGSSIYSPPELDRNTVKRLSFIKVVERSVDIMQAALAAGDATLCDFCFTPPVLSAHQWYHFRSVLQIREDGRKYAREQASGLPDVPGLNRISTNPGAVG